LLALFALSITKHSTAVPWKEPG